jgi:gliding motility-associated-like protein
MKATTYSFKSYKNKWTPTIIISVLFCMFSFTYGFSQNKAADGMESKERNYSSFSDQQKRNIETWQSVNEEKYYDHPDFGTLPDNSPCTECVEDLSKREKDLRYFVDINDPSRFYIQRGNGLLHFKENGYWKTIDFKLQPTLNQDVFHSEFYLNDVDFNRLSQKTEIVTSSGSLGLNQWSLFKLVNGEEQLLSEADWSNNTIGEDGMYIKNIFNGIDAELIIYPGGIKTNFIIKEADFGQYDAIIFRDNLDLSNGNDLDISLKSNQSKKGTGELLVTSNNNHVAEFGEALAYAEIRNEASLKVMEYQINENKVDVIVPAQWIEEFKNESNLIIDPQVTGTNTLAQALITGSEYNASCSFDNSCDQFLTVPAPANATFDDVIVSFTYEAINGAYLNEGAVRFATGGCLNPATPGFFWFCNNANPGTCALTNVSLFSDLQACLPAPSCSPQNVSFTMEFFRSCWGTAGCNNLYNGSFTPWTMTISGQTIEYTNVTNPISVSSTTVCEGGSITATTSGQDGVSPYTYNWSFNASGTPSVGSGASTNITFPNPGTVTLYSIVTDNCGNQSSASMNVTVNTSPSATITGDLEYCAGQTASISTGGFSSYSWSNGANTQNTTVTDADNPIIVTVTDANGCTGTSAPYSVTENPSPSPSISGASTYCTGTSANISAPPGFSNYSWSTGANTQSTSVTSANNPITVTVTNANGCSGTSSPFNVTEQATINYAETIAICQGQNATIHGNTESVAGLYEQTFSNGGCDSTASITLVVNPLPTITAAATETDICDGETTTVSASGGTSYTWDNGLGAGQSHTASPSSTAIYVVTGTDANGCENTDQVEITVNPLPVVDAGGDIVTCEGETITLTGSGTATTYTWDNSVSDGVSFTQPVGTVTYTVTGTANGCENTATVTVTVGSQPNADFTATPTSGLSPLDVDFTNNSNNGITYTWDFGNGQSESTGVPTDQSMTYNDPGSYEIWLTVTNGSCSDQASLIITVDGLPLSYTIPNVFTPNEDGTNDLLHMNLKNAASLEMEIFNRWGNLVGIVSSVDPENGWNGRHVKTEMPLGDGVYFYTYKIVSLDGEEVEGHNYVHLER